MFYSGRTSYALGITSPATVLVPTTGVTSHSNINNMFAMYLGSMIVNYKDYVTIGSNTVIMGRDSTSPLPTIIDLSFVTDPIIKIVTTS